MSKEKQIEELKSHLDKMVGNSSQLKAEKLYAIGYRRQSEGYWTLKRPNCSYYCSCCGKGIKIKYGERAAILWDYCPNCGARMKGGADDVAPKSEVAREIFEEIEEAADYFKERNWIPAMAHSFKEYIAELKKKYTEGKT